MVIKKLNKKIGLSLNPDASINIIKKFLPSIDLVLVMSVYPGFGGQKFIPSVLDKIKELRALANKKNPALLIEVDGGVNDVNVRELEAAGVDVVVAGSYVFKHENRKTAIESLQV